MSKNSEWDEAFRSLDLLGGTLITFFNDDEDMLEIRWCDGMWIDVGFIKEEETYYITTVADDTSQSWNNPLSVIEVKERMDLRTILQNEIMRCRS